MNDRLLDLKPNYKENNNNNSKNNNKNNKNNKNNDKDRLIKTENSISYSPPPSPSKINNNSNNNSNNNKSNNNNNSNLKESKFMKIFFDDVELVKQNILYIIQTTQKIDEVDQAVSLAITAEKEHELTSELSPFINEANKRAAFAKALLQRLSEECETIKTSPTSTQKELNELRIRDNLINTLKRKFIEVIKAYQNAQQKFKVDIKKKMKRQIQIVQLGVTNDEVEQIIENGGSMSEIFQSAILKGGVSDSVNNVSRNVQDKYQDIMALEASVAKLHEIFLDFAQLTEQQGEILDQIEYQVKSASDFIDEGNADMIQAVDYAIQLRKKQCCLLVIFLVIAGIIVAVVMILKQRGK